MDAPARIRFKAPTAYKPSPDLSTADIIAGFFLLQDELCRALAEANGIDVGRVKVSNPVSKWFTLSVGQEFAFTAAHERRHLWQAWRLRKRVGLADGG